MCHYQKHYHLKGKSNQRIHKCETCSATQQHSPKTGQLTRTQRLLGLRQPPGQASENRMMLMNIGDLGGNLSGSLSNSRLLAVVVVVVHGGEKREKAKGENCETRRDGENPSMRF